MNNEPAKTLADADVILRKLNELIPGHAIAMVGKRYVLFWTESAGKSDTVALFNIPLPMSKFYPRLQYYHSGVIRGWLARAKH